MTRCGKTAARANVRLSNINSPGIKQRIKAIKAMFIFTASDGHWQAAAQFAIAFIIFRGDRLFIPAQVHIGHCLTQIKGFCPAIGMVAIDHQGGFGRVDFFHNGLHYRDVICHPKTQFYFHIAKAVFEMHDRFFCQSAGLALSFYAVKPGSIGFNFPAKCPAQYLPDWLSIGLASNIP